MKKLRCHEGGMVCLLPYGFICGLQACGDLMNCSILFAQRESLKPVPEPVKICFVAGLVVEVLLTFLSFSIYAELRRSSTPPILEGSLQLEAGCPITPFSGEGRTISV